MPAPGTVFDADGGDEERLTDLFVQGCSVPGCGALAERFGG